MDTRWRPIPLQAPSFLPGWTETLRTCPGPWPDPPQTPLPRKKDAFPDSTMRRASLRPGGSQLLVEERDEQLLLGVVWILAPYPALCQETVEGLLCASHHAGCVSPAVLLLNPRHSSAMSASLLLFSDFVDSGPRLREARALVCGHTASKCGAGIPTQAPLTQSQGPSIVSNAPSPSRERPGEKAKLDTGPSRVIAFQGPRKHHFLSFPCCPHPRR